MINHKKLKGLNYLSPKCDDNGNIGPHFRNGFYGVCDACDTGLGGDFYDVQCSDDTGEIETIEVCRDCYLEMFS